MSAEAHLFDIEIPLPLNPSKSFTIRVRYWGPQSSNQAFHSDDLSSYGEGLIRDFEKGYLDIYSILGLANWTDEDENTGTYYQDLAKYIYHNEAFVLSVIIGSLNKDNPAKWYWDT